MVFDSLLWSEGNIVSSSFTGIQIAALLGSWVWHWWLWACWRALGVCVCGTVCYGTGWFHRFLWWAAEREATKLLRGTTVTLGSLTVDLMRGRYEATNVVIHAPRATEYQWSAPVLARVGHVYVEANVVRCLCSLWFLGEEIPMELYTVHVSDVQVFVERKHNIYNFLLLDPNVILPPIVVSTTAAAADDDDDDNNDGVSSTVQKMHTTTNVAATTTIKNNNNNPQPMAQIPTTTSGRMSRPTTAATTGISTQAVVADDDRRRVATFSSTTTARAVEDVNQFHHISDNISSLGTEVSLDKSYDLLVVVDHDDAAAAAPLPPPITDVVGDETINCSFVGIYESPKQQQLQQSQPQQHEQEQAKKVVDQIVVAVRKAALHAENPTALLDDYRRSFTDQLRLWRASNSHNNVNASQAPLHSSYFSITNNINNSINKELQNKARSGSVSSSSGFVADNMQQGLSVMKYLTAHLTATTTEAHHALVPERRRKGGKIVYGRVGRVILANARIFVRDNNNTSTMSSSNSKTNATDWNANARKSHTRKDEPPTLSGWNPPIVIQRVVIRPHEFCPQRSVSDDHPPRWFTIPSTEEQQQQSSSSKQGNESCGGAVSQDENPDFDPESPHLSALSSSPSLPALYQPLPQCIDVVIQRILAEIAKSNTGRLFQTALGEMADVLAAASHAAATTTATHSSSTNPSTK